MSPGSRLKNQRAVWWGREITLKLRPVGRQTDSRSRPFDRRGTLEWTYVVYNGKGKILILEKQLFDPQTLILNYILCIYLIVQSSLFGPDESQDAPNPRNQKNTTQKLGLIFKWMFEFFTWSSNCLKKCYLKTWENWAKPLPIVKNWVRVEIPFVAIRAISIRLRNTRKKK
ncbi:unnamed protein product [Nesidiocoris tenuis]|uniref:Uncharacterized protein n=1 Tax=Nesidiocoris tenuis TaxID=355587 RepID=A0A6H5HU13_9HEMI|nr:unnamed protein product [Nesidiocoris tenuis]